MSQQRQAYNGTTFKLNTGAEIPALGFGTWQDKEAQESAVLTALKTGYRQIDTAYAYGTQPAVGAAIKQSGVPRDQIFLTTKLWNNAHHPDDVEQQLEASLKNLGVDYLDLYLIHWPVAFQRSDKLFPKDNNDKTQLGDTDFVDTYKAMEKCFQSGKTKDIGVSNFSQKELERLIEEAGIVSAVHQIELHPYLQQQSFDAFHKQHNIHITQYPPFGNQNEIYVKGKDMGRLIGDPVLKEIGEKYGKNGAQAALAWGISHRRSVIPKSKTKERIIANFDGDFVLEQGDVDKIARLDKKFRLDDPSEFFGQDFFKGLVGKK